MSLHDRILGEGKGSPAGAPHSEQRKIVVTDILEALRKRRWKLGTRTDLEERDPRWIDALRVLLSTPV